MARLSWRWNAAFRKLELHSGRREVLGHRGAQDLLSIGWIGMLSLLMHLNEDRSGLLQSCLSINLEAPPPGS